MKDMNTYIQICNLELDLANFSSVFRILNLE